MPYFTVVAKDLRTDHVKTHTGIKAPNKYAAVNQVALNGNKNTVYDVWMTKHHKRDNRVKNWTPGRERHEHREQRRQYWVVLARKGRRGHKRFINTDGLMCYRWAMQMATDSWRDTSAYTGHLLRERSRVHHLLEALHE